MFQPNFIGVHSELSRHAIHVRFRGEESLWFARRSHLTAGKIVRVHARNRDPSMLGAITAAGVSDAADDCPWPETAVGAAVEVRFHLMSDHRSVALDASLQPYDSGVSQRTGDKLLAIFHDHFHHSTGAQGEQVTDQLVYKSAFATEVAANRHRIHANFFLRNVQSRRHAFFQTLRRLIERPHLYAILIVDPNQTAMGFEKCLMNPGNRERILHDHIKLRESFDDVSTG